MIARRCPPRGVPVVSPQTIARHHRALASAYDHERLTLVLMVAAIRKGNTWAIGGDS